MLNHRFAKQDVTAHGERNAKVQVTSHVTAMDVNQTNTHKKNKNKQPQTKHTSHKHKATTNYASKRNKRT